MKKVNKKTIILIVVIALHSALQLFHAGLLGVGLVTSERFVTEQSIIFKLLFSVPLLYFGIYFFQKKNFSVHKYLIALGYLLLLPVIIVMFIAPYELVDDSTWLGPSGSIYIINPYITYIGNYFFALVGGLIIGWDRNSTLSKYFVAAIPFLIFIIILVLLNYNAPEWNG